MAKVYYRWYGHAKTLLYQYPQNKKQISTVESDVIHGRRVFLESAGSQHGTSDPTQRKAMALSSGRYVEMGREVRVVEALLVHLREAGRQDLLSYIDLAYFKQRYTEAGAAMKLGRSPQAAKRWNRILLKYVALQMGWIDA